MLPDFEHPKELNPKGRTPPEGATEHCPGYPAQSTNFLRRVIAPNDGVEGVALSYHLVRFDYRQGSFVFEFLKPLYS